ncbi:hypothetical protein ACWT_3182 [Actinoplanes sp. SE50]|uniref:hypothetical protein n=1 Tax=unclassified Actinoplanes TaxID=2626549 RepID=UPI00023EC7A7|nr:MULTISPECIES: hypothetical protein [unclassified Actinoplanes]AEV84205.1 hypothetical protein ACPL_3310 [Actinoplanes sp. SE50/110]ATO82597.1 hypothetical protein ACWT_3182 [Actinoplanes sp. SE50]SLM00004.1 hypothetical protein ACSP50_3236 [Actinoplanes sp. SE50/110]
MSLTGVPLLCLVAFGAVAAMAGSVVVWRRGWRPRVPLRALSVLLTETLALLTVGLAVNRSEEFYPSWAALFPAAEQEPATVAARPGDLDAWLRAQGSADSGQEISVPWKPRGWTGWHLSAAPTVVVPAGYLQHPTNHYSAVVVTGTGWTVTPGVAEQTVVVFVPTTAATGPGVLTASLPALLSHDLRVTARRWALVAPAAGAALVEQAAGTAPDRYPAIALVRAKVAPVLKAFTRLLVAGHGVAAPVHPSTPPVPPGIRLTTVDGFPAGIAWAIRQTPPPLDTAIPAPTWVPSQPPVPRRSPGAAPKPKTPAGPPQVSPGPTTGVNSGS